MWQCALQSVSQEMDSVWLLAFVAVIQDGQAVSVKHAYQLMDAVSFYNYVTHRWGESECTCLHVQLYFHLCDRTYKRLQRSSVCTCYTNITSEIKSSDIDYVRLRL